MKHHLRATAVLEIRRRVDAGEKHIAVAAAFGVTTMTVWSIASGKTWKSVLPGDPDPDGHPAHNAGESHHRAKLADPDVREIRRRFAEGETQAAMSVEYHVTPATIGCVVHNRTWRHLLPKEAK